MHIFISLLKIFHLGLDVCYQIQQKLLAVFSVYNLHAIKYLYIKKYNSKDSTPTILVIFC